MAATRTPVDDFDMGKLQKSLRQRQRHSIEAQPHVAKLSPAEIRSLNQGSLSNRDEGARSSETTRLDLPRTKSATPPLTPENTSAYHAQTTRITSTGIPTPPRSPDKTPQKLSHVNNTNGQLHIYAPRPSRTSMQAEFMIAQATSRPSSQTSYRGLPTYRGNEVTRTGSMTMLQHPDQTIVTNPLSNFSRPRQRVNASPISHHHDEPPSAYRSEPPSAYRSQSLRNQRRSSADSTRLPHRIVQETPTGKRSIAQPQGPPTTESFPAFDGVHNGSMAEKSLPTIAKLEKARAVEPSKSRRKSLEPQSSTKRNSFMDSVRRRTFSFSSGVDTDKPEKSLPKQDIINRPAVDDSKVDFEAHPGVRPLSRTSAPSAPKSAPLAVVIADHDAKAQGREVHSAPVIGRCSCCGKLRKPGFASGLSPVMENEHLRTNFNFEAGRTSTDTRRHSTSTNRSKYTPIIPVPMAENQTRQASIAPMPEILHPHESHSRPSGSASTGRPSIADSEYMSSGALPSNATIRSSESGESPTMYGSSATSYSLEPHTLRRVTRFASLHGLRQDAETASSRSSMTEARAPPSRLTSIHEAVTSSHYNPSALRLQRDSHRDQRDQRSEKSVMFIAESKPVLYRPRNPQREESWPSDSSYSDGVLPSIHTPDSTFPSLGNSKDRQPMTDYSSLFSSDFMESPSLELTPTPTGSTMSSRPTRMTISVGGR